MTGQNELEKLLAPVIEEMALVAGLLWEKGWAEKNAGNASVDVTAVLENSEPTDISGRRIELLETFENIGGRYYLVTRTLGRMRDMAKDPDSGACLIRIGPSGSSCEVLPVFAKDELPTSELPAHLGVYSMAAENELPRRAVLHTHPQEIVALTHNRALCDEDALNELLFSIHPEMRIVLRDRVGFLPYCVPGSCELGHAAARSLAKHRLAVWEKHGAIAAGENLEDCFDLVDLAAKAASIYFLCKSAGYEPEGLTPQQTEEFERIFYGKNG